MDDRVGVGRENVVGDREECAGRALERILANLKAEGCPKQTAERWGLEEAFPQKEEWLKVLEERLRSVREGMAADEGKSDVLREDGRSRAAGAGTNWGPNDG
jgi:hypothetical protein